MIDSKGTLFGTWERQEDGYGFSFIDPFSVFVHYSTMGIYGQSETSQG